MVSVLSLYLQRKIPLLMYHYFMLGDAIDEATFGIHSANKAVSVWDKILIFFIYQAEEVDIH